MSERLSVLPCGLIEAREFGSTYYSIFPPKHMNLTSTSTSKSSKGNSVPAEKEQEGGKRARAASHNWEKKEKGEALD